MKLLQKSGLYNLLLSSILLLLAGGILYGMLTSIIDEEVTEKLEINAERIAKEIEAGREVPSLPPVIEIEVLEAQNPEKITAKDTLLMDPIEEDLELFRELQLTKTIGDKAFRITVREVILEPHDYLNSIGLSLAVVFILLLIGLFLLNRRISKIVWKPFYQNLEAVKQFSLESAEDLKLQPSSIKEFQELNSTLEKLTGKISADFLSLKEFSENAAHEMQTPLAILQNKLDEALQDPNLGKVQAGIIQSSMAAVQRLSRLNQTLLLLTKLDNRQFSQTESIDLSVQIIQTLDQMDDFVQAKHLQLSHKLESVSLKANPFLLDTLLNNLIGNAIRHNYEKGQINIELHPKSMQIANTSKVDVAEPEKMFDRFTKAEPSSSSPGLGLAIVRKICGTHNWSVTYRTEGEWHYLKIIF